jgi:hypothetical protein
VTEERDPRTGHRLPGLARELARDLHVRPIGAPIDHGGDHRLVEAVDRVGVLGQRQLDGAEDPDQVLLAHLHRPPEALKRR